MVSTLAKIHKGEKLLMCGALAEQILHPPPPPRCTQTKGLGVVYLSTAEHLVLFEPKCLGSRAVGLATTFPPLHEVLFAAAGKNLLVAS